MGKGEGGGTHAYASTFARYPLPFSLRVRGIRAGVMIL